MPAMVSIAAESHMDRCIGAIVRAFEDDPAVRWMYPDKEQFHGNFPAFVRAFGGRAFAHQSAHYVDGFDGAALWLPPGVGPDEEALGALLQKSVAEAHQPAVFAVFEQMAGYHPQGPHWHLPLIGVVPDQRGKGHGTRLMKHALARCDGEKLPAYLESTNPKNLTLYERLGFVALGRISIDGSPPIIPMLRKPS